MTSFNGICYHEARIIESNVDFSDTVIESNCAALSAPLRAVDVHSLLILDGLSIASGFMETASIALVNAGVNNITIKHLSGVGSGAKFKTKTGADTVLAPGDFAMFFYFSGILNQI
jgi:hypothetical protein